MCVCVCVCVCACVYSLVRLVFAVHSERAACHSALCMISYLSALPCLLLVQGQNLNIMLPIDACVSRK